MTEEEKEMQESAEDRGTDTPDTSAGESKKETTGDDGGRTEDESLDRVGKRDSSGFNPLLDKVRERSYTRPNVPDDHIPEDFQEPDFTPPPPEPEKEEREPEKGSEPGQFNPASNDMDDKDKEEGARQMAEMVLDGYSALHVLGQKMVTIPEDKLYEMYDSGEIDPSAVIPVSDTDYITVNEYFKDQAEQSKQAISVSDSFREKARPAMIRVFVKRGVTMTDEQFLIYLFTSDILQKATMIAGLRKQNSMVLDQLRKMNKREQGASKSSRTRTKKNSAEQREKTPPPEPEPEKEREPRKEPPGTSREDQASSTLTDAKVSRSAPKFGDEERMRHMQEARKK